jgi:hypothetical protein
MRYSIGHTTMKARTNKMIKRILFLMLLTSIANSELSIVMKGNWIAECGGVQVSLHNRYDKALESAINQKKNCNIIPPTRFEITFSEVMQLKNIELTWDLPGLREDGSEIEKIDRFIIYVYFNGVFQNTIEVSGTATVYELLEVETGTYEFQISTVESGQEGNKSPKIYQVIE